MAVKIHLSRGHYALIDEDDLEKIQEYKWHVNYCRPHYYACAWHRPAGPGSKRKRLYLHRLLTGCPEGLEVDHINGEGLDCRRENLRVVRPEENKLNRCWPARASPFEEAEA